MAASRLALGTAQFGLPYGIANTRGQVSAEDAAEIVAVARNAGMDTVDTAVAYGDSESCLGALGVSDFSLVTKLPPIPSECRDTRRWIEEQVEKSCERMQTSSLYGLLLHRPEDLAGRHKVAIAETFKELQHRGAVRKVGISIYSPDELPTALSACPINLVQAPLNLVDRRLIVSGWLDRLHESGIEVHTRSAFLQGLLLMSQDRMPKIFLRWSDLWGRWHTFVDEVGMAPGFICLRYPLSHPQVSRVVVGVDSADQLRELINIAEAPSTPASWPNICSNDENLVDPSRWRLN